MSRAGLVIFIAAASVLTALAARLCDGELTASRSLPVGTVTLTAGLSVSARVFVWLALIVFIDFVETFFRQRRRLLTGRGPARRLRNHP